MLPWGHLAVGYLLYSFYTHSRYNSPPKDYPILALAIGTQFPDLIDKPFAWTVGLLPSGRSLTHSLITAVVLITALWLLIHQRHRVSLVIAFGIGYLSHLGADALRLLEAGEYASLGFLAWPLIPLVDPTNDKSFIEYFQSIEPTSFFMFQLVLVGLAVGL